MALTPYRIGTANPVPMATFRFRLWPEDEPLPPGTLVVLPLPSGTVVPEGFTAGSDYVWRVIQAGDPAEVMFTAPYATRWDIDGQIFPPGSYTRWAQTERAHW